MATSGLESATSVEPPFVVLGQMTEEENRAPYDDGRRRFAERLSRRIGASLVPLSIARWTEAASGAGLAFEAFRRIHRAAEPIYSCPLCGAEAAVVLRESPADFIARGGRLDLTDDLTLA